MGLGGHQMFHIAKAAIRGALNGTWVFFDESDLATIQKNGLC
jgi:hypothetical protein